MGKLIVSFDKRLFNEEEIGNLLSMCESNKLKEAIEISYYEGLKIKDILKKVEIPRRTLQGKLSRLSKRIMGSSICFEQIRQSCIIRLFNKGYSPEYIQEFMGYSKKDIINYKRKVAGYVRPKLRYFILQRDNFKCRACGDNRRLHIDHINPVSKGGKTIKSNLRVLCEECNIGKGDMKQ